jgi:ribosomal protein S18 acetylase RimI-like enzyme
LTGGVPALSLRAAREDDREFLAGLYASTRADELAPVPWSDDQKRAFMAQQFAAQSAHYAEHFSDAAFDVVLVDGEPAGRLIVARREREGELKVIDIALLPEQRGRGIGTRLLRPLLREADEARLTTVVYVERNNPALALYERLGFAPVEDTGVYLRMERPPGAAQAKIAS